MKTLIIYGSKTGVSEDVATYIAPAFESSKIVNISTQPVPALKNYDKIIFGTGIYFSKIHKDIKKFISAHLMELKQKDYAIYYCCGSTDEKKRTGYKEKNFCADVLGSALAIDCVGGKMNPTRAGFPQNIVVYFATKLIRKQNKLPLEVNYELVDDFIEKVKRISKKEDNAPQN